MKRLLLPARDREALKVFRAGEEILLEGVLYTARDKVHQIIADGKGEWPFDLNNSAIYYCGPASALPGYPLGSCGPTTSSRMDRWTPDLYRKGVAVTIGKGPRSSKVVSAVRETGGLYLSAFGGCGALYASRVKEASVAGFESLGPQAVYRVRVEDFPVFVGIDASGRSIYQEQKDEL